MKRVQGKTALVTAAGRGIGRASALALAREGATVWATDVDEQALAELAAEAAGEGLAALETARLDVLDTAAVTAFAGRTGKLDVLFNCAGFVHSVSILQCEEKDWDFSFDLNAKAMYRTIRAFLPAMLEGGGGSIINMASAASSVKGVPNRFAYGASKAAVIGLSKAVVADFVQQGIRCNAIAPARWNRLPCRAASASRRSRPAPTKPRCAPRSWRASPSAAWAAPKRWPRWWCTLRATSHRSPRAPST